MVQNKAMIQKSFSEKLFSCIKLAKAVAYDREDLQQ